jgi:hypothetical protein
LVPSHFLLCWLVYQANMPSSIGTLNMSDPGCHRVESVTTSHTDTSSMETTPVQVPASTESRQCRIKSRKRIDASAPLLDGSMSFKDAYGTGLNSWHEFSVPFSCPTPPALDYSQRGDPSSPTNDLPPTPRSLPSRTTSLEPVAGLGTLMNGSSMVLMATPPPSVAASESSFCVPPKPLDSSSYLSPWDDVERRAGEAPVRCRDCLAHTASIWRRDYVGNPLCNACALDLFPGPATGSTSSTRIRTRGGSVSNPNFIIPPNSRPASQSETEQENMRPAVKRCRSNATRLSLETVRRSGACDSCR